MDENHLEKAVDDVLAKRRIEGNLRPPEGVFVSLLRHPLLLTIFAFFVTTIVGGYYDQVLKQREQERIEAERAQTRATKIADEGVARLQQFTGLVFERQTRAQFLEWAVERGNGNEARLRKKIYDDVVVKWHMDLPLTVIQLTGYLATKADKDLFRDLIESKIAPVLDRTDTCLTTAYDEATRRGFPFPPPDAVIDQSPDCGDMHWKDWMETNRAFIEACVRGILTSMPAAIRREEANVRSGGKDKAQSAVWFMGAVLAGCSAVPTGAGTAAKAE